MIALVLFSCAGEDDGSEEIPQASIVGAWEVTSATITLNDQEGADFAANAAQCYQNQGVDVSDQDVLLAIVGVIESEVDEGNFFLFSTGTSFVFEDDNSYTFQSGTVSGSGAWQINGDQLVLDDAEATTFAFAINGDQLALTDVYTFTEADLTDSGLSVCIDQLVSAGIMQLTRTQ